MRGDDGSRLENSPLNVTFLNASSADTGVCSVKGLSDVQVKLLSGRYSDVKAIPLNGFENLFGIGAQDILSSFERGILE